MATARILVVDNEQHVLSVMKRLLSSDDYEVVATDSGEKAIELINSDSVFDLMIFDVRMSPIGGMELLKLAVEKDPSVPVMMMTAYDSEQLMNKALDMGAFSWVQKLFGLNKDEFLTRVQQALRDRSVSKPRASQ